MKKICLINVGANASHGSLRSPLFPDKKFEFIPIPETFLDQNSGGIRYSQLKPYNGTKITDVVSEKYHSMCTHYDPEFDTFTYGDYPTLHPRAANLRRLSEGDYIFFFARLVCWRDRKFTKDAEFGLIGYIEIEEIFRDINERPPNNIFQKIRNNAHIIRAECDPIFYDGFWVSKGSKGSERFKFSILFNRDFVEECGLLDSRNEKWKWDKYSSELSTIGSYLRSSKLLSNRSQLDRFWRQIHNNLPED